MTCLWKCRACGKSFTGGIHRSVFDNATMGNHYDRLLHFCELPDVRVDETTLPGVIDAQGIADCVGWVEGEAKPHTPKPAPFQIRELAGAARELLALIDAIDPSTDGPETDRVFALYEFDRLRAAVEPMPSA